MTLIMKGILILFYLEYSRQTIILDSDKRIMDQRYIQIN